MPYKRLTALYLLVNDIFRRRFYIAEQYLDYAKFTQNRCHFSAGFQYIEVKKNHRSLPRIKVNQHPRDYANSPKNIPSEGRML